MYVVSVIVILLIFLNYFLSVKLYGEPKNENFLNNVKTLNFPKEKNITPNPRYVIVISILLGILIGLYVSLCIHFNVSKTLICAVLILILACYFIEISRRISIKENKIILSKLFSKRVEIPGNQVQGIYIYSYNKKFLKKRALTTKLVIVTKTNKTYKFILSSLDNKAVLNMIKENFGVTDYKMYIGKN